MKRRSLVIALATFCLGTAPLVAQGRLVSAYARVDLTSIGGASVAIDYTVMIEGPRARVPLEGLVFGGARFTEIVAHAAWGELSVSLRVDDDGRVIATVGIPRDRFAAGPFSFTLSYELDGTEEWNGMLTLYEVPILAVAWPSAEAVPETFTVEATVGEGQTVYESFPSGMRAIDPDGGQQRYRLALPVMPALVSLRTSRGSPPLGTLPRALDLFVLVLLAGCGVLAWRQLAIRR